MYLNVKQSEKGSINIAEGVVAGILKEQINRFILKSVKDFDIRVFISSDRSIYITINMFLSKTEDAITLSESAIIASVNKSVKTLTNLTPKNVAFAYIKK
ncbi:hypothetical protein STIUS_v1c03220 [Spiroplasma sp. TIUS-1]|uniref:hypothetical protein n=1 Tax=Spiroplasma sp. TIUS-1 TaxID=216963 RepID=UPI001397CBBD|nr:hypothetical protein [Spiroplasma sp. TIUS-1]QHX35876.1 hypothetical protein STIUS_v1c03220 [Spiroplasma sp. TIUS-1]